MLPELLSAVALLVLTLPALVLAQTKIVLSNDDGWATANIRAQYAALTAEEYNVVLSAPATNQSGTGSLDLPPTEVWSGCEFYSCPAGSPPTGHNGSDPRLNYVNSFPATSARFGIESFGPLFFSGGMPDIVVSGPNVGGNTGLIDDEFSGTVGAADAAVFLGIPAIAISGAFSTHTSYTTLDTPSDSTTAAQVYAALSVNLLRALLAPSFSASDPILPAGTLLNVNYPDVTSDGPCASADAFRFVLTRAVIALPHVTPNDVKTCGSKHLPTEASVVAMDGCFASVTVLDGMTKLDTNASTQKAVLNRLGDFLSCATN